MNYGSNVCPDCRQTTSGDCGRHGYTILRQYIDNISDVPALNAELARLRAALTTAEAERDAAQDKLADYDHTLLMKLDPSAAGSTDLFTWGTCLIKQRDRARQEAAAAKAEAEHERMRLSACGVAAMMNTPETVMQRLSRDHPCWSASYGDVCNAVDREMEARKSLARLQQEREGLIATINLAAHWLRRIAEDYPRSSCAYWCQEWAKRLDAAVATPPPEAQEPTR